MASRQGIWVTPNTYIEFAESSAPPVDEFATRKLSLDWNAFSSYLPNPDPVLKKLGKDITVYRDLLSDPHVGSCVLSRKSGVGSLLWEIDRGKSKSRQSRFIEEIFANLKIHSIIQEILNAPLFGYQPMEVMWDAGAAAWYPRDLVGKPPEWFVYGQENELRFRTKTNMIDGEAPPSFKFLCARNQPGYNNPYGDPVLCRVFWPVMFKKGGWKFWAKFVEKFGMPWIVGKHRKSAGKAEKDEMLDMLDRMIQDGISIIPEDASVDTLEPKGGTASADIYKGLLDFCNSEISKAILGQTLTTEITGNGSYAAAQTHQEVRKDVVDDDRMIVEQVFNELIDWAIEHNFGPTADRPRFTMYAEEDVDLDLSMRDKNLTDGGRVRLTKEYYQRAYGFQDDEVDVVEPVAPPAIPPGAGPQFSEGDAAPGQEAIDSLAAGIPPALLQDQAEKLLQPIVEMIDKADSFEEVSDNIAKLYPKLDMAGVQTMLEKAVFLAESWGHVDVESDA